MNAKKEILVGLKLEEHIKLQQLHMEISLIG
jgi:hypothetical protein